MKIKSKKIKILFISIILAIFTLSLFFPAFYTEFLNETSHEKLGNAGHIYMGWKVLIIGWAGIISGAIGWYANIGLFITLYMYLKNNDNALFLSIISLFIACSSIISKKLHNDGGIGSGIDEVIAGYGTGFYLWIASYIILFIILGTQKILK